MTEQISTNADSSVVWGETHKGVQKPKRTYNRKPKQIVVEAPTAEPIRQPLLGSPHERVIDCVTSTLEPPSNITPPSYGAKPIPEPLPDCVSSQTTRSKRTYKKKPIPEPPKEEVSSSDETNVEHCVSSQPSDTGKGDALLNPSYVGGTPLGELREKKPRTEKQQEAFRKMREARLKKQEELSQLKAFDKEQKLMKKEHDKLNKLKEKLIYENCTPPLVEPHGGTHKVSNIPNYIFV